MANGKLIVFEGVDGAGTTTQAARLKAALAAKKIPIHCTAQPSSGPVGVLIRQILSGRIVSLGNKAPGWETLSLLFAADRQDQQENEIEPHLKDGIHVICDRYVQSSAVYQSAGAGSSDAVNWILEINSHIRKPDVVFYLKIDGDESKRRREARNEKEEIFDDPAFQEKLIRGYDDLETLFPDTKIITVDAKLSVDEISQIVLENLCALYSWE